MDTHIVILIEVYAHLQLGKCTHTYTNKAENCVVNYQEQKWAADYINTCLGMCGS